MHIAESLKNYIAIDSTDAHGTRQLAEYISEMASSLQLDSQVYVENVEGVEQANIVVFPKGSSKIQTDGDLLLVTGLETENPGDYSQWTRNGANPFKASVIGDNIFGLGVHSKGDLVAKLAAISQIKSTFKKFRPVFVGTFGREKATGIRRLIRKKILNPKIALVGAPTQMQWSGKGLGYARVDIRLPFSLQEKTYRAEHDLLELGQTQSKLFLRSSTDSKDGILANPIIKMLEYLSLLPDGIALMGIEGGVSAETEPDSAYLEIDLVGTMQKSIAKELHLLCREIVNLSAELMNVRDEEFLPPYSNLVLGQVRTTTDEITLSGVCRLVPAGRKDHYELWLEKLRQAAEKVGARVIVETYVPPYTSQGGEAFLAIMKSVSSALNIERGGSAPVCTSASILKLLGCESIVFGPGQVEPGQHAALNYIKLSDIQKATHFYANLIEGYNK